MTATTEELAKEAKEQFDDPWEAIAALMKENQELKEELAKHKDHTGRELADVRGRISEVEEDAEEEPGSDGSNPGGNGPKTPLEDIVRYSEEEAFRHLSANQERARFIARDIHDYAEKAPAGLVISSSDMKKVIAAKEGERPHNQTVARIMEFLDDFGQDDVDVIKRRGQKLVVIDPDAADRLASHGRCDGGKGPTPGGGVIQVG